MPAKLLRPWIERLVVAGTIAAVPATALAGWPWSRPAAPAPVTTVGPPIYAPSVAPTVTNYQPGYGVPTNTVPAAVAPSLVGPPTTYTPVPVTGVMPAPAVTAPAVVAAPACGGTCGVQPRVSGYVPPAYGTTWSQVPTTTYRPVVSVDPATGLPINAVQPCTTNVWQARRVPNSWWGGLWPATSPPPTVVAYTPATIAAYPQAKVAIAPAPVVAASPVVTQYAPRPVVTQYAPAVTTYAPPATQVVTQYAPAPAPVVTQYAPAPAPSYPTIPSTTYAAPPAPTTYAAPPSTAPLTQACPHGCPNGQCQGATTAAPTAPANVPPTLGAPPPGSSYPQGTIVPNTGNGGDAASIAPRLDNGGTTTRSYTSTEYDNAPVVPITPPGRVIETPRIETPHLQSPTSPSLQGPSNRTSSARPSSPLVPSTRSTEKPASTTVPERNLRLVPDPDAEKLELRRDDIPNLIKPGDRTTQAAPAGRGISVPIAWPAKSTVVMKSAQPALPLVPAAIATPKLDDSGWRSVAQ